MHLCAEPTPTDLARLIADSDPDTPLGAYLKRHFERFGDFGGLDAVHPGRTFSGELSLDVGGVTVRLIEVGPAHTSGDLIVHLPDEGVVCTGDVVFGDDHPVHWAGPIEEIHRATVRVLECDPRVIVPGHGPVMTPADVRGYADYLLEVRDAVHAAYAAGRSLAETSAALIDRDSRAHWGLTERMAILAALEYRALDGDDTPPDLVRLVDFAAGFTVRAAGSPEVVSAPPGSRDS
ncbi:MBL fold metallo-hydrolase [Streptomyces sp.]|uniref:MBL fold metallo-hydrolase n=1 Tax=Streptomyces sp. TaxID=1931 RepID=UPI002F3EAC9D